MEAHFKKNQEKKSHKVALVDKVLGGRVAKDWKVNQKFVKLQSWRGMVDVLMELIVPSKKQSQWKEQLVDSRIEMNRCCYESNERKL